MLAWKTEAPEWEVRGLSWLFSEDLWSHKGQAEENLKKLEQIDTEPRHKEELRLPLRKAYREGTLD